MDKSRMLCYSGIIFYKWIPTTAAHRAFTRTFKFHKAPIRACHHMIFVHPSYDGTWWKYDKGLEDHDLPELTDKGLEDHDLPELTDKGLEDHDLPELIDKGLEDHDLPKLIDKGLEDRDLPELIDKGLEDHDLPELIESLKKSMTATG
jgi:hypothetical protein